MKTLVLLMTGLVSVGVLAMSMSARASGQLYQQPEIKIDDLMQQQFEIKIVPTGVQFVTVDLFVDSGDSSLAAYQVDLKATNEAGRVLLAGIEGGEHEAFSTPAHYDPKALNAEKEFDHVVLAAFSTGENLPSGRTRVATLHYQMPSAGELKLDVLTLVTGDADAGVIQAKAEAVVRPIGQPKNEDVQREGDGS